MTQEELTVTRDALELYLRLQMGQLDAIAYLVDRQDMSQDGRKAMLESLELAQLLITGSRNPGEAAFPTDAARQRNWVATRIFEEARYALQPIPLFQPGGGFRRIRRDDGYLP